jgi:sugar lactone lactonase YvrE
VKRPALALLLVALALPASASALPSRYILPGPQAFPEGVTNQPGTDNFFVSSTANGTIYRGNLGRAKAKVFLAPGGRGRTHATGLKATRDRLVVSGSSTGFIYIYDLPRGKLVRRVSTGDGGLINDVTLAPNGDAYFTDSMRGLLFRVPAKLVRKPSSTTKALKPFARLITNPAAGKYVNGIVSVGNRYLLVVSLGTGRLVRVDVRTRAVREVDLGGNLLTIADGMIRSGHTLYVVNTGSQVAKLTLSRNWLKATLRRQVKAPSFLFPTTVAIAGKRMLVVNSQFDKQNGGTPVLPFTLSAIPLP